MRVLILLLGALAAAGQEAPIRGDYLEDRSNHVFGCTCEFSTELANEGREAVLGWHFTSGQSESVDLSGVTAVLVIDGDRMLTLPDAVRRSVLFIGSGATFAQFRAVEKLIRRTYSELAGNIATVETALVEFERTADAATLRIAGQLDIQLRRARLPGDALPASSLWYDPFVPLTETVLGTRLASRYSGAGLGHRWNREEPGVTGYFGTFALLSSR